MAHDTREDSEGPTFVLSTLGSAPGLWTTQTYNECHLLADGNRVLGIMEQTARALCTLHAFSALGCCKAVFANPGSYCAMAMCASGMSLVPSPAFMPWCSHGCVRTEAEGQPWEQQPWCAGPALTHRGSRGALADGMVHRKVGDGRCPTPYNAGSVQPLMRGQWFRSPNLPENFFTLLTALF